MIDNYLSVLEQYEGELLEVRRGRGAWISQWADGIRLLKEYRGSVKRLEFEEMILARLKARGIFYVDQYVRNKEDSLLSGAEDGTKYILKEWYLDRECSLKEPREILAAVEWIAKLHQALQTVEWQEQWDLASMQPPPLEEEMRRHSRELKRVRNFISAKRKKNEFELCVMQNFNMFYEQALKAQEGFAALGQEYQQERLFLCHGDLNQHHILMRPGGAAFVEFSQMHRGSQMQDLYHFMRKVMEKHGWSEQLGSQMMRRYHEVLPLEPEDRECLYYLFLYPEKYWKQLNYYNNARKTWIPAKNVEKLQKLEAQQESRNHFLERIK